MDEKWIEAELGKLANTSVTPSNDLDNKARMRIRGEASRGKGMRLSMSKIRAIGVLPATALLVVLVFFTTMALLQSNGPAGGGELALGKYVSKDGFAWVELIEGSQFMFNRHIATSYWPRGEYIIQEDELILSVADTEQYRFSIVGDTIVFQGGGFAESLIAKGTVFSLAEEQGYLELEQLPDPYPVELAKDNGDVVQGHNIEKLDRFISNVMANLPDWVRMTVYTKEGDAIIQDLKHDKGKLTLFIDGTRDKFGTRAITEYDLSEVYKEVRDDGVYYLAKTASGEELILTDTGSRDYQSFDKLKVVDIKTAKANKGDQFSVLANGEFDSVSLIYVPASAGEIKAANVLPGEKKTYDQFMIDFDFNQVNGNARLLAFQGDVGVVAGNYRLTDEWAQQDYAVAQHQGGKIPQVTDMSIVVDGKRSAIVTDKSYSLGNQVFFELSVSADVTLVEYVFFPEDDSTFAIIYPGIESEQGEYRIEFNNDKPGYGYFLFYNLAGENNVVVRTGHHSLHITR